MKSDATHPQDIVLSKPDRQRKARGKKRRSTPEADRFDWWKLPWLLLLPLGILWPRICANVPALVERYYSAGVYPTIVTAGSVVTSLVPFSVAELIRYALVLGTAVELLGSLIAWALRRISGKRMLSVLLSILILIGAIWNLVYITWGFNYFRVPLADRMGLPICRRSVDELETLTDRLAVEAGAVRATLTEDETGVFTLSSQLQEVLDALPQAYEMLEQTMPVFAGRTTRAKRVLCSEGLSWAGIAGIYVGLTAEPNINAAQPDLLLPQAAAHEMAHQLGIASENEAEFAAHLACLASADARVRYSGLIQAYIACSNALHDVDSQRSAAITDRLHPGIRRDIAAYNAYWDRYEGPVEDAFDANNDRYLKHNNQSNGVKSYGESVDLLLAYYDQTKN